MSTLCLFASLLEHCQCVQCEDVCLIFTLGSVLDTMIPEDHIYHLIHPRSAMIVDSVKINTSLTLMIECRIITHPMMEVVKGFESSCQQTSLHGCS